MENNAARAHARLLLTIIAEAALHGWALRSREEKDGTVTLIYERPGKDPFIITLRRPPGLTEAFTSWAPSRRWKPESHPALRIPISRIPKSMGAKGMAETLEAVADVALRLGDFFAAAQSKAIAIGHPYVSASIEAKSRWSKERLLTTFEQCLSKLSVEDLAALDRIVQEMFSVVKDRRGDSS
jgi:hypothetical protein